MSFLLTPPPSPAVEPDVGERSAAAVSAAIERALAERPEAPDIDPVLREMAQVAARLAQHPRVRDDAQAMHLLRLIADSDTMERAEFFAEALQRYLVDAPLAPEGAAAAPPGPAPAPRASRVLLRL